MVTEQVADRLLLVGTAHVSPESVREVEAAIQSFRPNIVAVELDPQRLEALEDKHRWENTPIHKILQSDRLWLFLTQVLLASYQRRLGQAYGSEPGAEMMAAVRAARATGAQVVLADRDIGITMKRAYRSMRWKERLRLTWELLKAMAMGGAEEADKPPPDAQQLTKEDVVTAMMTELGQIAPSIKTVVLDERDEYLASRIQTSLDGRSLASRVRASRGEPPRVVAVVGAGHLPGIRRRIESKAPPADLQRLEIVPQKRFHIGRFLFTWVLPFSVLVLFGVLAYEGWKEGNWSKFQNAAVTWFLVTGGLAAVGTALARGHILSILTAFLAAPITTLHPALAAGWFAGGVEAWVREPTTRDFQNIARITSAKEFFGNRVMRVLMVAALSNLGAMAGFALASSLIASGKNVWNLLGVG